MIPTKRLLLKNIKQLVPIAQSNQSFLPLSNCFELTAIKGYSVGVDQSGKISAIGNNLAENQYEQIIDCSNYIAVPGFVDAHTHALFAGDRSFQLQMKLKGSTYRDIAQADLGILETMRWIRKATEQQLIANLEKYLLKMVKLGTTTVEVKSGFGLDAPSEVKMLKVIEFCRKKYAHLISVIATFCGAHTIPAGKTEQEQTADVIDNQLPAVSEAIKKGQIMPKFIDVFCERGFFGVESSKRIMLRGKELGMIPSFHGDQLSDMGSGVLGADVGARAISHMEYLSEESAKKMAQHKIACVLLPTTQNIEKLPVPPIKLLRTLAVPVALGSDFCPNSFCYSPQLTLHYACVNYRMFPGQALAAMTINSAYSLGVEREVGSIQVGKYADILLLETDTWRHLMYQYGDSVVKMVIKRGKPVWEAKRENGFCVPLN